MATNVTDIEALRRRQQELVDEEATLRRESTALQRRVLRSGPSRYRTIKILLLLLVPPLFAAMGARARAEVMNQHASDAESRQLQETWSREHSRVLECSAQTKTLQWDLARCESARREASCDCVAGDPLCDCL